MSNEKELRSATNDSGFLLQLRVAYEVKQTSKAHGWEVLVSEHPWRDPEGDREGFIDLVLGNSLGNGIVRMVIECKRKPVPWIFLIPDAAADSAQQTRARCMWIKAQDRKSSPSEQLSEYRAGWHNFPPQPPSYISEFCIVKGTSDDQKPLLERIAGQLVEAVDALALEEIKLTFKQGPGHQYIYVPVIVTTADLQVCRFKTEEVSLTDGKLPDDVGEFESVPFIRFSKSLTTKPTQNTVLQKLQDAHQDKTRTIIVANAKHFTDLLKEWKFGSLETQPPWGVTVRID